MTVVTYTRHSGFPNPTTRWGMPRLVGFGHRSQVGKATAAQVLTNRYSIADTIRSEALHADPWLESYGIRLSDAVERLGWEKAKREMLEVRHLLMEMGLEGRAEDPDFWINGLMNEVAYWLNNMPEATFAITDVRFPNEIEAIHDLGGVVVRIDRANVPKLDHPTECALDDWSDWDHIVENKGGQRPAFLKAVERALVGGS